MSAIVFANITEASAGDAAGTAPFLFGVGGTDATSAGKAFLRFQLKDQEPEQGLAFFNFMAGGTDATSDGEAMLTFGASGYDTFNPPHLASGTAPVFFASAGGGSFTYMFDSPAAIKFPPQREWGTDQTNDGRAFLKFVGQGSDAVPAPQDVFFMNFQGPGFVQATVGYSVETLFADVIAEADDEAIVGVQIIANALAGDGLLSRADYQMFIEARATAYASLNQMWFGQINISAIADATTTGQYAAFAALYANTYARVDPAAAANLHVSAITSMVALALLDGYAASPLHADATTHVDVGRIYAAMSTALAAAIAGASAVPVLAWMSSASADAIAAASALSRAGMFAALAADADAFVRVQFEDDTQQGWVLNAQGRADDKGNTIRGFSSYSNFPYTSFATFPRGGKGYGTGPDGIYLLEGDTDDGDKIPAYIRSGLIDFDSRRDKRMESLYVGYTSDDRLMAKMITTTNGTKVETWYTMTEVPTAQATREARILIGKGLHSVYWAFELHNTNGADMAIDIVTLWPVYLDRRIG